MPKLRTGTSYFPAFLEPRRTIEKALTAVIQEAWVAAAQPQRVPFCSETRSSLKPTAHGLIAKNSHPDRTGICGRRLVSGT